MGFIQKTFKIKTPLDYHLHTCGECFYYESCNEFFKKSIYTEPCCNEYEPKLETLLEYYSKLVAWHSAVMPKNNLKIGRLIKQKYELNLPLTSSTYDSWLSL